MRNGKAVAKLEAEIGPMAFLVKSAEAEDPSLLPPGVRIPMRACQDLELKTAIARWLANRQAQETPGSAAMARAYRAGAGGLGRMYPAKHAVAALNNASYWEAYWATMSEVGHELLKEYLHEDQEEQAKK